MAQSLSTLIEKPIVQAPMAGVTTPAFVAACANAGALGSIGAGYLSVEATRDFIREVRKLTDKPFQINLFVPEKNETDQEQIQEAYQALQPIGEQLGMPEWDVQFSAANYEGQLAVVMEEKVPVCSFTFGLPETDSIQKLKAHGIFLIGTATTVQEAQLAEQRGMDAVVLQGSEAGGHRGSFQGEPELVSLQRLVQEASEKIGIPFIAAGGIYHPDQVNSLLGAGAVAVQVGTALLAADESGANRYYKEAVLHAEPDSTVQTTAFSGKAARGIENTFITMMKDRPIAPYPLQNDLTKPIRAAALKKGKSEYMSLWAGESVQHTTSGSAEEIIQKLITK